MNTSPAEPVASSEHKKGHLMKKHKSLEFISPADSYALIWDAENTAVMVLQRLAKSTVLKKAAWPCPSPDSWIDCEIPLKNVAGGLVQPHSQGLWLRVEPDDKSVPYLALVDPEVPLEEMVRTKIEYPSLARSSKCPARDMAFGPTGEMAITTDTGVLFLDPSGRKTGEFYEAEKEKLSGDWNGVKHWATPQSGTAGALSNFWTLTDFKNLHWIDERVGKVASVKVEGLPTAHVVDTNGLVHVWTRDSFVQDQWSLVFHTFDPRSSMQQLACSLVDIGTFADVTKSVNPSLCLDAANNHILFHQPHDHRVRAFQWI